MSGIEQMRAEAEAGARAGHAVTVTAIGPSWIAECPCGDLSARGGSKRQANQHGLAHLRLAGVRS